MSINKINSKGKNKGKGKMKRVFLDTETTGLVPGQIAQLSLIINEDNKELRAKNYYFKVKYMSEGAVKTTGKDMDFYDKASNSKVFSDFKEEILNELQDATLVAHNLSFDENFISTEFWRENIMFTPKGRFCTMKFFRPIVEQLDVTGRLKNPKLEELVDFFNINRNAVEKYAKILFNVDTKTEFHDAMYDTTAMFVVFQVHKEKTETKTEWQKQFCN